MQFRLNIARNFQASTRFLKVSYIAAGHKRASGLLFQCIVSMSVLACFCLEPFIFPSVKIIRIKIYKTIYHIIINLNISRHFLVILQVNMEQIDSSDNLNDVYIGDAEFKSRSRSQPAFWDVDYLRTLSVCTLYGVEWVADRYMTNWVRSGRNR
jgi:hypothetical protein